MLWWTRPPSESPPHDILHRWSSTPHRMDQDPNCDQAANPSTRPLPFEQARPFRSEPLPSPWQPPRTPAWVATFVDWKRQMRQMRSLSCGNVLYKNVVATPLTIQRKWMKMDENGWKCWHKFNCVACSFTKNTRMPAFGATRLEPSDWNVGDWHIQTF